MAQEPVRSKKMAFIAARMSVLRGRPLGDASGISGYGRAHSASLRSLGYAAPSPRYIRRCSSVHIAVRYHGQASNREAPNPAGRYTLLVRL